MNGKESERIQKIVRGRLKPQQPDDFEWLFYYMLDREVELIRCLNQAKEVIKNERKRNE